MNPTTTTMSKLIQLIEAELGNEWFINYVSDEEGSYGPYESSGAAKQDLMLHLRNIEEVPFHVEFHEGGCGTIMTDSVTADVVQRPKYHVYGLLSKQY